MFRWEFKNLITLTITQVSKQWKINLGILLTLKLNLFLQTCFQIIFLRSKTDNSKITVAIKNKQIKCKGEGKLLGITIDEKLTSMKHIANMCSLANNRERALIRIRRFLSTEEAKYLSAAYIMSAFKYCALVWMFCNKTSNSRIYKIHKRILRLAYEMEDANFQNLLLKDNLWNIHENNIKLMIYIHEIY